MKRYSSEKEILDLVRSFENASVSKENWRHAEHLTVALYYLENYDMETATGKMRSGIFNLLEKGFGLDLSKEMPYHETLTVFWMRTISVYIETNDEMSFVEKANELVASFDKEYPLRFYTKEFLFSEEARSSYLEGDIPITAEPSSRGDLAMQAE